MAVYHRQGSHISKKKKSISFVIRDKLERYHRSGVNSLQYDFNLDWLYSAGRDSVIRVWGFDEEDSKHAYQLSSSKNSISSNARSNPKNQYSDDCFIQAMEHHTDWVNDIVLCSNNKNLISVSNDTTIKVWDNQQSFCLSTLRSHKDYARCLAYAKDKDVVASAGFDRMIYLWDVQTLTNLTAINNTVTTKPLDRNKTSIYSLAINSTGTLLASGSTEKVIRLWDPRSKQKLSKLRGHTDNVRCLLFSKDGSQLLSGSSDGTIRLWSIGQQRCVSIIRLHDEGVWTLQTDESFSTVYSGGKDCKLFMTNLKNTSESILVCAESAPILKILYVDRVFKKKIPEVRYDAASLWVSTTDSAIKNWRVPKNTFKLFDSHQNQFCNNSSDIDDVPINEKPDALIKGNPAIVSFHILNDKRYILTKGSDGSISLYDVLRARKVEHTKPLDTTHIDEEFEVSIKDHFKMVYVPNWFTVDLKIGMLCIHLDESECFSAWVSAKESGFAPHGEAQVDHKVNLGVSVLQALFKYLPSQETCESDSRCSNNDSFRRVNQSIRNDNSSSHYTIPYHTPIIVSEGNQTLLTTTVGEVAADSESVYLHLPSWVTNVVINKYQPKFTKVSVKFDVSLFVWISVEKKL